ncbi:hypothetical protein RQM47_03665 [Rubrivirga sp. S365]|uniref:Uncharacterized protein n=1 Tax=Rubrivirga litoralis TaxID=3075598 RepID=A0ABU3BLS3_9BACT|nr:MULTISPECIES: hypothetical protein [unclassified Rubrivirga]MDT0630220.1 hypothetical protein [Rubrivirga sp. F394]MDT7855731.1 hypothetical protein [Rubrivirga sp. S365]
MSAVAAVFVHLALAVALFFLMGWIGRHTAGMGYISLSLFVTRDEAPAFNFAFRAFGPIAFIVIVAAALYGVGADWLVGGIWFVAVYYSAFRVGYNLAMGRRLLLNWPREALILAVTVGGAWLLYDKVIRVRQYLLPDAQSVSTELWIIVALFIYATLNRIEVSEAGSRRRKEAYLAHAFRTLRSQYQSVVEPLVPNAFVESVVYSIMVYESFQRPPAFQALERVAFPRFSKSLGPMQVQTESMISNTESVRLGTEKIVAAYERAVTERAEPNFDPVHDDYRRGSVVYNIAEDYNPDHSYMEAISALNHRVIERFYPSLAERNRAAGSYANGLSGILSYV